MNRQTGFNLQLTSLRQDELDQVQRVLSQPCKQDTPCRSETIAQQAN
jgi:hypothetical protein